MKSICILRPDEDGWECPRQYNPSPNYCEKCSMYTEIYWYEKLIVPTIILIWVIVLIVLLKWIF